MSYTVDQSVCWGGNTSPEVAHLMRTDYAILVTGNTEESHNEPTMRTPGNQLSVDRQTLRGLSKTQSNTNLHPESGINPNLNPHPRVITRDGNPPGWPPGDRFRRVPDYSPVNHNLDFESRPIGMNPIIGFALTVTFTGNAIMSVSYNALPCC
jgi:hypothetical protein